LKFPLAGGNKVFWIDHDQLKDDETVTGGTAFAPQTVLPGPCSSNRGDSGEKLPCTWAVNSQ